MRYFPLTFPRRLFGAAGLGAAIRARLGHDDLLHLHGLWNLPMWTAARRARQAALPYVLSPRGMLDLGSIARSRGRKQLAYRVVERRNLAGAALLHATSTAEAQALDSRGLGVPIAIVPNGTEIPKGEPSARGAFRHRLGVSPEAPLVVFLGRIHPIKRLDLLAAAFERVRRVSAGAHVVVAGPDGDGHRRVVAPRFASMDGGVHWTGELGEADRWTLLADADALVMCSDSESFGMSVVEAMAAAVPVVVTQTCPWEEVRAAGSGFWVPQSAEAIAGAVVSLLGDRNAARAMGERGNALVRSKYSWDAIARSMADHYRAVMAASPGPATAR